MNRDHQDKKGMGRQTESRQVKCHQIRYKNDPESRREDHIYYRGTTCSPMAVELSHEGE